MGLGRAAMTRQRDGMSVAVTVLVVSAVIIMAVVLMALETADERQRLDLRRSNVPLCLAYFEVNGAISTRYVKCE